MLNIPNGIILNLNNPNRKTNPAVNNPKINVPTFYSKPY